MTDDKDFATAVSAWLSECSRPAPRLTIAPLANVAADGLWAILGDLGIKRDQPSRYIDRLVQANPRASGLEQLLTYSAATASLATGQIFPELCTTRWGKPACELITSPPLTRRHYSLDLDSLGADHPYGQRLNREALGGSVIYLQADGAYNAPSLRDSYDLAEAYKSTATVTKILMESEQRRQRAEETAEEERRMMAEANRLHALGRDGRILEEM